MIKTFEHKKGQKAAAEEAKLAQSHKKRDEIMELERQRDEGPS